MGLGAPNEEVWDLMGKLPGKTGSPRWSELVLAVGQLGGQI